MPEPIITAIIAAGATLLGGLIAGFASAYGARQKLRELQLVHSRERRDLYLANARVHAHRIYVPLQAAITSVVLEYDRFRSTLPLTGQPSEREATALRSEIEGFDKFVTDLLQSGADAFLTTELSERLRSFAQFLRASRCATKATESFLLGYDVYLPFIGGSGRVRSTMFRGGIRRRLLPSDLSISVLGMGIILRREEIVAAPLASELFEERFVGDTIELRALIKEVTLGSKHLPV
jgi:hypothetical protein